MKLGCIADDFTGATDLANNLVRAGMRATQTIGVPTAPLQGDADTVVVALKSRTIAPAEAVAQSLAALHWLRANGAQQIYFKYCSTFDSTAQGNIGPVTEALMAALGTSFTIATPAFPDNKRTVFKGHLFVGEVLLNESGMQHHPLTPMTDANLVRVLQAQTRGRVGLIDHLTVARGPAAISERFKTLQAEGIAIAIVDAVTNDDLLRLGPATNGQVQQFIASGAPARAIDPLRLAAGADGVGEALAWAAPLLERGPILVYSTAAPAAVKGVQGRLGVEQAGAMVEKALAAIAQGLVKLGVRQLLVAGGETSGACVQALGVSQMQIGPQIDPGVPWCHAVLPAGQGLHLALKSGNFGGPDFFSKAFDVLR
jgi:uncharacterized protein YgbK (DUF1537 family)